MVYGYIRVSTAKQGDSGHSLDAQSQAIADYCASKGLATPTYYRDEAVSAAKPLRDREGLRRMGGGGKALNLVLRNGDVVVVTKLDRAFRNTQDALSNLDDWNARGVDLVILDFRGMSLDTREPIGKLMFTLIAGFAEFERSLTSQRTRTIAQYLKTEGLAYGHTPYGWRREGRKLVPIPERQEVIARMRSLWGGGVKEGGLSYESVASILNRDGIRTTAGKKWSKQTIAKVITSSLSREP